MANTYTQIYLHVVFAVSARICVISPERREELQKYITGIITRNGQKLIAIYCTSDHAHLLLGLKPNIAPSDLIGDIKTGSTIISTSSVGPDVDSLGKKASERFLFPIHIWIGSPIISTISPRITAESRFNVNMLNFWSDTVLPLISVTFLNRWNES